MSNGLTPAELTLLGLLVEQPRHGYELESVIAERGMREWTEIGFSSIYYLLRKLRDRELITETATGTHAKARKVFTATAAGRRECAEAAEAAIAEPQPVFPPLLVGLANQPAIPPERLRAALDRRADAIDEKIDELHRTEDAQPYAPEFVRAIFDYSLTLLRAEQRWLAEYRQNRPVDPDSSGDPS